MPLVPATGLTVGRRYYQTVNVSGNYNINSYISYFFKWKKPEINVNFNISGSSNRNSNFINSKLNHTLSKNYEFGVDVSKEKEKKYDISLRTSIAPQYIRIIGTARPGYPLLERQCTR